LLFTIGLTRGTLGFDLAKTEATIFDGGERPISTTTLADLGQAIVGVLQNPSDTRNKVIYIQTARVSQLQLLRSIEKRTMSEWTRIEVSTVEMESQAYEMVKSGDTAGMRNLLLRAIFGEGYGCDFQGREANKLVGVKQVLDAEELSDMVAECVKI
jgi:hypothetical protein